MGQSFRELQSRELIPEQGSFVLFKENHRHPLGALPTLYPSEIAQFNDLLFKRNHALYKVFLEALRSFEYEDSTDSLILEQALWPFTYDLDPHEASQRIARAKTALPIQSTLANVFGPNIFLYDRVHTTQKGRGVILTDTHKSDWDIFLETGTSLPNAASVVLDNHIDLAQRDSEQDVEVLKSNVYTHLIESGLGGAFFIGPSQQFIRMLTSQKELDPDNQKIQAFLKQNPHVAFANDYRNPDGTVSIDVLTSQLSLYFSALKKSGIQSVFVSLDMDHVQTWQEELTATEYNALAIILQMGIVDLDTVLVPLDSIQYQLRRARREQAEKLLQMNVRSLLHLRDHSPNAFTQRTTQSYFVPMVHKEGTTIEETVGMLEVIKRLCREYGLQLGIPCGDSKVIGSISELSGPDVNGNTARAAKRFSDTMLRD